MEENKLELHTIVLRLAAILLSLVLITTSIVSGRYARYVTSASGSDSARVAKYQITVSAGTGNSLTLSPASPAVYTLSVTSGSEVAVEYDLIIDFPDNLPDGIEISVKRGEDTTQMVRENNRYTAKNVGTFSAQGGTHTYALTFTATMPVGADILSGISIRIDARQVD